MSETKRPDDQYYGVALDHLTGISYQVVAVKGNDQMCTEQFTVTNCTTADLLNEMEDLKAQLAAAQQELVLYRRHNTNTDTGEVNVNVQRDLDKSEGLRIFAAEIAQYATSIKILSNEMVAATKIPNLRAEESMEAPAGDHAIRIVFIINGENVPVRVDNRHQLSAARATALIISSNGGSPVTYWKITDETGTVLDPNEIIGEFGFPNNVRLFLYR